MLIFKTKINSILVGTDQRKVYEDFRFVENSEKVFLIGVKKRTSALITAEGIQDNW